MSIIWLVENPCDGPILRDWIIGNFAVRNFASLTSLLSLAEGKAAARPDVILCNVRDCEEVSKEAWGLLGCQAPWLFADIDASSQAVKVASHPEDLEWKSWLAPGCLSLTQVLQQLTANVEESEASSPLIGFRDIYLDLDSMCLKSRSLNTKVTLTVKELKLMRALIQNAEQCISRSDLTQSIWGGVSVSPRALDTHVSRLRKVLQPCGLTIENIYGGGYRLCVA